MTDAYAQPVEIFVVAQGGDDIAQAVVPTVAAALFKRRRPGGISSSSWATSISSGAILKNWAIAATDLPLRFIKVVGINRRRSWPDSVTRPASQKIWILAAGCTALTGQCVHKVGAGVVTGTPVFATGVAQTYDQLDG